MIHDNRDNRVPRDRIAQYTSAIITNIEELSKSIYLVKTRLKQPLPPSLPPQFVNVWIPGYEAIPLSIAYRSGDKLWLIVKPVGETTYRLINMKPSSYIGLYGPLGKPLVPRVKGRLLLLSGGSGLASISQYMQYYCRGVYCRVVHAAWRFEDIGWIPEYVKWLNGDPVTVCMDEGCDVKGVLSDYLALDDVSSYEYIIICGPIGMITDVLKKIDRSLYDRVIVVMESIVKCGVGLCGSCRIGDKGLFLCIDGPGFHASQLVFNGVLNIG